MAFASPEVAERVAGSVVGTILPLALMNPELDVIADPALLDSTELYFNAARLDRPVALRTSDHERLAEPCIERITRARDPSQEGARS